MARSVWKGPFFEAKMSKNTFRIKWIIWSRRSSILPEFVGCYAQIYTGKVFVRSKITDEKVGHKFGEFASTRKTSKKPKIKTRRKKVR